MKNFIKKIKKSWYDKNIQELKHSKKIVTLNSYVFCTIALLMIVLGAISIIQFGIIGAVIAYSFIVLANFQLLFMYDSRNDINRINMWIYLKEKLEE